MSGMSIDDFMGHSTSSPRGSYLSKWRERDPARVNVVLHRSAGIYVLWRHQLPRLVVTDDNERKVWGANYLCLAGETRFWADGKLSRLQDLVGETVEVLAGDNVWRPAKVSAFGVQKLVRIVFTPHRVQSNTCYEVTATPDHRWLTTTRGEVRDLRVGDRISATPLQHDESSQEYRNGFVHGLVFGDGCARKGKLLFQIDLHGAKQKHLLALQGYPGYLSTTSPPSAGGRPLVFLRGLQNLKRVPDDDNSLAYQAGFLAGWMATDGDSIGNHDSPSRRLHSIDHSALEWIKERASALGMCVTGEGECSNMMTNKGMRTRPLRWLVLRSEPVEYTVAAIIDEGREEEVFCVVEPITKSFTLEGGLLTGNCWEDETLLKKQYKRLEDDTRVAPPTRCPLCKLIEWTYQAILDGEVKWTDVLFEFSGDDPKETRVIHAGGICNMFASDDLNDEDKRELKKHGIYQRDAWKENAWAKASYLFQVVDIDHPSQGVQIAIEKALLGDKVRTVIADRRASLGKDRGDPSKSPYVIQWEYNPADGIAFDKKYHARPMESLEIREDVMALISGEPLDVANLTRRFNAAEVRAQLEEHARFEFPWKEFFGEEQVPAPSHVPGSEYKGQPNRPADLTSHATEADRSAAHSKSEQKRIEIQEKARVEKKDTDPAPAPDEEVDCDECGKVMRMSDKKCPHCGYVYEPDPPPPPKEPERRSRRGAAPQQASAPKTETKAAASKPSAFPDDDGDVPF